MPPTTLAMRRPRQCCTRSMASCATCCASSRVGHSDQRARNGGLEVARCWSGPCAWGAWAPARPWLRLRPQARSNSARSFGFGFGLLLQQRVQHGQQEGRGLAAAGLAGDHQVDVVLGACRRRRRSAAPAGSSLSCTSVGWVKPRSSTARSSSGARPIFTKPLGSAGSAMLVVMAKDSTGGKRFGRRKVALHFKSVGHFLLKLSRMRFPWSGGAASMVKKHQPSNDFQGPGGAARPVDRACA